MNICRFTCICIQWMADLHPEESMACRCSFPMETVSHVLYQCPSHKRESEPKKQLHYVWLLEFLEANESVFVFDIP
jgi:hypothetical protein